MARYVEFRLVVTACLSPLAWHLGGIVERLLRGAQPRSPRLSWHRPLLGRCSAWLSGLHKLALHGPYGEPSSHPRLHSSPSPASGTPRAGRGGAVALSPIFADVASSPDHQAFVAGVEAGVFVIATGIGVVALFGLFRWA